MKSIKYYSNKDIIRLGFLSLFFGIALVAINIIRGDGINYPGLILLVIGSMYLNSNNITYLRISSDSFQVKFGFTFFSKIVMFDEIAFISFKDESYSIRTKENRNYSIRTRLISEEDKVIVKGLLNNISNDVWK